MRDLLGRTVDYMRISITDRCNLRCRYCMLDGIALRPASEILTFSEIVRVCEQAAALGICKFKVTGGEPLVRKGCAELIGKLKNINGIKQVTMTTNGILLKENLEGLLDGGLDAVNISLDTLEDDKFEQITGFRKLDTVLAAIDGALDTGLKIKVNTVLQPGINEEEWERIMLFAKDKRLDVRFIEMMPIGCGRKYPGLSNKELLNMIKEKYGNVERDDRIHGNGPAIYVRIPGFVGSIGFISAIHGGFCENCNRIRMTAAGDIKPCLCYGDSLSVREAARDKNDDEVRETIRRAVLMKPEKHCFGENKNVTELRKMVEIGG